MKQTSQNKQTALNVTFRYSQSDEGKDVMKEADVAVEINKIPDVQTRYLNAGIAQSQSSIPTTEEVKEFKRDASQSIVDFSTGLRNIADDSKDKKLIDFVNHPITYFFKATKNKFGSTCELVIQGIESYSKTILASKVNPDNFKVLRDKVALYVANKDNAKLIRNSKKVLGTANLKKIDDDAKNLIKRITNAAVSHLPANSNLRNGLIAALVIPKDGTQHNAAELILQNEDGTPFIGQASAVDKNAKEIAIYVVNDKSEIHIPSHLLGRYPFEITAVGKVAQTIVIEFKKGVVVKIIVVLINAPV